MKWLLFLVLVGLVGCGGRDLFSEKDWTKFMDAPSDFKGQTIQTECLYDGEGWRKGDRLFKMPIVVFPHGGGVYRVNVDIPQDVKLPNIQPGHRLIVTFVCEDGANEYGNRVITVERPD